MQLVEYFFSELFSNYRSRKVNDTLKEKNILTSIEKGYQTKTKIVPVRDEILSKKVAYDSGGYYYLMNPNEELPTAEKVARIMQTLGLRPGDIAIQFDTPATPIFGLKKRMEMVETSAKFFHDQREFHNCVPVVHGWEKKEYEHSLKLLTLDGSQDVAIGSMLALTKRGITIDGKKKHFSSKFILERIADLLRRLDGHQTFVLGGGGQNMSHLVWAFGGKYVDGSSWRALASRWQIMIYEKACRAVGKTATATAMKKDDWNWIKQISDVDEYPLNFLNFAELRKMLEGYGSASFMARAMHNSHVLTMERDLARDFENDHDRYMTYLKKRWGESVYWRARLKWFNRAFNNPFVDGNLDIYFNAL